MSSGLVEPTVQSSAAENFSKVGVIVSGIGIYIEIVVTFSSLTFLLKTGGVEKWPQGDQEF